jgi:hypothetical protein
MLQERSYDKGDYGLTNSLSLPLFEMFKAMSGGGRETSFNTGSLHPIPRGTLIA